MKNYNNCLGKHRIPNVNNLNPGNFIVNMNRIKSGFVNKNYFIERNLYKDYSYVCKSIINRNRN